MAITSADKIAVESTPRRARWNVTVGGAEYEVTLDKATQKWSVEENYWDEAADDWCGAPVTEQERQEILAAAMPLYE